MKKPTKYIDPFEQDKRCPNFPKHTKCPGEYQSWHEWAEKKSETHFQILCPSCNLYKIWVKSTTP